MIWWTKLDKFMQEKYPECCMFGMGEWKWKYVRPEDLFSLIEKIEKQAYQDGYEKSIEHRRMSEGIENSSLY